MDHLDRDRADRAWCRWRERPRPCRRGPARARAGTAAQARPGVRRRGRGSYRSCQTGRGGLDQEYTRSRRRSPAWMRHPQKVVASPRGSAGVSGLTHLTSLAYPPARPTRRTRVLSSPIQARQPSPPCCCRSNGPGSTRPGSGCFAVVHRDSIPDAVRIVRERPVDAVLVSVHRCGAGAGGGAGPSGPRVSRHPDRGAGLAARPLRHRDAAPAGRVRRPAGGGCHFAHRLEPAAPGGRPAGHPRRGPDPGTDPRRPGRRAGRCPALPRGHDPAGSRHPHRHQPGAAALRQAEHPDVAVCPGGAPVAQELPRRRPAAPRGLSVRDRRASRWPMSPIGWNTPRPRASAATSGPCSASPRSSSAAGFPFRWRWSGSSS